MAKKNIQLFIYKIAEWKLQLGDTNFMGMERDATLKVDVIVSAANGDLDHCGGLALTISKAGQKSSNVF